MDLEAHSEKSTSFQSSNINLKELFLFIYEIIFYKIIHKFYNMPSNNIRSSTIHIKMIWCRTGRDRM